MLHPDDYCRAKAAPPGSSLHYSLLKLREHQQHAIRALYALRAELLNIVDSSQDSRIAHAKLLWWQEELQRLFSAQPQHPITRVLAAHYEIFATHQQQFTALAEAAEMTVNYDAYPGFEQLLAYCHRAGSSVTLLHAHVLGFSAPETSTFAHQLGVGLSLLERLRRVRQDALNRRFFIPDDELQRFGIRHQDLAGNQTNTQMRQLFQHQAARIRHYWQQAQQTLPAAEHRNQRSLLILVKLKQAVLDEIEADGWRLLEQRLSLTPLRKLWLSWRRL